MLHTNQNETIRVLDGKFLDSNGKIDISYFTGEVKNYVINCSSTEYLYHWLVDDRRHPIHSIAWQALTECVDMELKYDGLRCTSAHLKKWFEIHGLDYKEVLKPLITQLTDEREEYMEENE